MEECIFVPPLPSVKSLMDAVEDELTCAICLNMIDEPKALVCGHVYHGECVAQWVRRKRAEGKHACCPTCQHPIAGNFRAKSVLPLQNVLDRIRTYACGACGKTVKWTHLGPGNCPSRRLRHLKCGQEFPEKELRTHMDALCPVLYSPPPPIAPVDEEEEEEELGIDKAGPAETTADEEGREAVPEDPLDLSGLLELIERSVGPRGSRDVEVQTDNAGREGPPGGGGAVEHDAAAMPADEHQAAAAAAPPAAVAAAVEVNEEEVVVQPANDLQPRLTSLLPQRMPARLFVLLSVMAWLALALVLVGLRTSDPQFLACRLSSRLLPFDDTKVLETCLPADAAGLLDQCQSQVKGLKAVLAREHETSAKRTKQLESALAKEQESTASLATRLDEAYQAMKVVKEARAGLNALLEDANKAREQERESRTTLAAQLNKTSRALEKEKEASAGLAAQLNKTSRALEKEKEMSAGLAVQLDKVTKAQQRLEASVQEEKDKAARLSLKLNLTESLQQSCWTRRATHPGELAAMNKGGEDEGAAGQLAVPKAQTAELRRQLDSTTIWPVNWIIQGLKTERKAVVEKQERQRDAWTQEHQQLSGVLRVLQTQLRAEDLHTCDATKKRCERLAIETPNQAAPRHHELARLMCADQVAVCVRRDLWQLMVLRTEELIKEGGESDQAIMSLAGEWMATATGLLEAKTGRVKALVDCDKRLTEAHVSHVEEVEELEAEVRRVKLQCISGQQQ